MGTATALSTDILRADTEYFLEVTAAGGNGESETKVLRFQTLPAPKTTVFVVR
jgi:hypothetical protein